MRGYYICTALSDLTGLLIRRDQGLYECVRHRVSMGQWSESRMEKDMSREAGWKPRTNWAIALVAMASMMIDDHLGIL